MTKIYEKYVTLTFQPAQECIDSDCQRLTTLALIDPFDEHEFQPVCPRHGYASGDDYGAEVEANSITRFVVSCYDEKGSAQVVGPCPLDTLPYYEPPKDPFWVHDRAWCVDYTTTDGNTWGVYVVWWDDVREFAILDERIPQTDKIPAAV